VTKNDYGPDICTDFLIDFIKNNRNRPFLAYYPTHIPHKHWDFHNKRDGYVTVPELDARGKPTGRPGEATLKSNVEYLDYLVGRIVNTLDELGLRENTVILFTSDNGTSPYGKGKTVMEKGVRVPMIANGPGIVKPAGLSDALVDLSDVLPTLLDFAGGTLPENYEIDGISFAPILRGETNDTREYIFSYLTARRMVRDKRYLLDGGGKLYDCGTRRDNTGYKDVTDSTAPEVVAVRKKFDRILAKYPLPDTNSDIWKHYQKTLQKRKDEIKRVRELRKQKSGA
jgi:arylsulfatase A-like enzyme